MAAIDIAVSAADGSDDMLRADLTDYGQALEALRSAEAVVHLANIPAPGLSTPPVTSWGRCDRSRFPRPPAFCLVNVLVLGASAVKPRFYPVGSDPGANITFR